MVVMQPQMRIFVAHRQIRRFPGSNTNSGPRFFGATVSHPRALQVSRSAICECAVTCQRACEGSGRRKEVGRNWNAEWSTRCRRAPSALVRRRLPGAAGRRCLATRNRSVNGGPWRGAP